MEDVERNLEKPDALVVAKNVQNGTGAVNPELTSRHNKRDTITSDVLDKRKLQRREQAEELSEDSDSKEEKDSSLERSRHHSSILETTEDMLESEHLLGEDINLSAEEDIGEENWLPERDGTGQEECTQFGQEN